MDKTTLYAKKIFIFLLVFALSCVAYFEMEIAYFIIIPVAFLSVGLLIHAFTGVKPPFLYGTIKSDTFINEKGGFWLLFKPILILIGLLYDIVAWTLWGVFQLYQLILDIIFLAKTILYWIFHAILWFLKLYVPPIVLLYRWFIHYLIKWPWWLYKLSFVNINNAYKRNYYFVSVWGTVIALGSVFIFYYVSVVTGVFSITAVGVILAFLPLSWSFGEIASIKKANLVQKPYWEVRKNFGNGMDAVRNVLIYLLIFLVLIISQIILDIAGWIPYIGLSVLGISLNINTAISFVLILLAFIFMFSAQILPVNLLFGGKAQFEFQELLSQLVIIWQKFVKFLFVRVPATFFGSIVLILPALMFVITMALTLNIKDKALETRINALQTRKANIINPLAVYTIDREIEKLQLYQKFPIVTFDDILSVDVLNTQIKGNQNRLGVLKKEMEELNTKDSQETQRINKEIAEAELIMDIDSRSQKISQLDSERKSFREYFQKKKSDVSMEIRKKEIDNEYASNYKVQVYIVFLFVGIWISVFAGLVLAFLTSFAGNIYYDLYHFNEDGKPSYLMQKVYDENERDNKQPLLGFSLLIITIIAIVIVIVNKQFIIDL